MPVKVKICGITNLDDALVAIEAGADALGFVFYEKSPRRVSVETVAEIVRKLPAEITKMGVFVDAPLDVVLATAETTGLSHFQFHGKETPEYCDGFENRFRKMKAFQMRDESSLATLVKYAACDWLLDSWSPSQPGGIGETFNWKLAIEAHQFRRPFYLAGGLTPENVGKAIATVKPYGVDVSSGVEARSGKKDHQKVRDFIRAAKSVASSDDRSAC